MTKSYIAYAESSLKLSYQELLKYYTPTNELYNKFYKGKLK